jgi:tetratricopeptide (TPR) repeat protein
VSFYLGDFDSAAKYFQRAVQRSPPELLKAAEALLMTGDLRLADEFFAKYVGPVKGVQGGRAAYQMAQWEFLTGRRKAGIAAMEKLAPELEGGARSLALSQLAIWKMKAGDAEAFAGLAAARPDTPGARVLDAYGLLLAKKYAEALPLLQAVYEGTNPSADGQVRVLLAWARVETGGFTEAGKLLEICPLPLSSGEPMFASLVFPRYFALRAEVLEKQGKPDEAKKNRELFMKYGGGEITK